MAVTSNNTISLSLTGDVEFQQDFDLATNPAAPGVNNLYNLLSGNNTITVPSGSVSVLIVPPSGNLLVITYKGINGDTGVPLHKTNPSLIGLDTTVTTFILNASNAITGLRLIFS